MNYIHAKQQRNFEAAVFYRKLLHFPYFFNPFNVEEASYFSFADLFCNIRTARLPGGNIPGAWQIQLAQLFGYRHLFDQVVNEGLHFRIVLNGLSYPCLKQQENQGNTDACFFHIYSLVNTNGLRPW